MPERILRDYSTSEKFDGFPGSPETLFTRLLTKVDDYGRFDGDPVNVRGACYPRAENLRANTVDAWLKELSDHHLILCYQVASKRFLAIINFRQRLRLNNGSPPKPKFPPPPGKLVDFRPDDGDWREMPASGGESREVAASRGECPPYADTNAVALSKPVAGAKPSGVAVDYSLSEKPLEVGMGETKPPSAEHPTPKSEVGSRKSEVGGQTSDLRPQTSVLRAANMGEVVAWIQGNVGGWAYDNCKVAPSEFTVGALKTVLYNFIEVRGQRPEARAITIDQCQAAWLAAVKEAHAFTVDGMTKTTPAAVCTAAWKRLLAERAQRPDAGSQKAEVEASA